MGGRTTTLAVALVIVADAYPPFQAALVVEEQSGNLGIGRLLLAGSFL